MKKIIDYYRKQKRDKDDIQSILSGVESAIVSINGAVMLVVTEKECYSIDIGILTKKDNFYIVSK